MNQKGIAYLLVLILGGIIVTSSIVYYSSTLIESRISSNSRMAKEVFYHAESSSIKAIATIFKHPEILNTDPTTFSFVENKSNYDLLANVTFKEINRTDEIPIGAPEDIFDPVLNRYVTHTNYTKDIFYNVTSQGELFKNGKDLLPRTVGFVYKLVFIRTHRYAPADKPGDPPRNIEQSASTNPSNYWPGFNYGINSGSTLTFSGSTVVRNGSVYAKTNVNLGNAKNQLRIDKGEAYSSGTITGVGKINPVGTNPALNPNRPPLTYPTINQDYYKSIADLILTGNQTFNSYADIPTTQPDVKEPNEVIVVYVNGDLRITGNFVNTQPILLVVGGTVTMNGNANIGSPTIPFGIIATGNVNRSNGNAEVNGFYYTPGKIDMKGNFNLRGALVGVNGVTLTGNVDITYNKALAESLPLILDPYAPGNTPLTTIRVTASPGTIIKGSSSTLTWVTEGATSLSVTPSVGNTSLSGSASVSPSVDTTYTFTATGPGGTVTVSIAIIVIPEPRNLPEFNDPGTWKLITDTGISRMEKDTWWQKIGKIGKIEEIE